MRRMSADDIVISPDDRPSVVRRRVAAPKAARASADKPKSRRKPARLFRLSRLQKLAAGGVALTAVVMTAAIVWHAGVPQRLLRQTTDNILAFTAGAGFRVEEITIAGRARTPSARIVEALGVRHGQAILGVDIEEARDRLESIESIRSAAVERRLPATLHLVIAEREPVAIWQNNGQFTLVDRDGHLIPGSIEGFERLPVVVGDGAPQRADELLSMLAAQPDVGKRVKAAVRVGNRRWDLRLDDIEKGIDVKLPENEPEAALKRLSALERGHGLTAKKLSMIDLRFPDRLVLRAERDTQPGEKRKDNGA